MLARDAAPLVEILQARRARGHLEQLTSDGSAAIHKIECDGGGAAWCHLQVFRIGRGDGL